MLRSVPILTLLLHEFRCIKCSWCTFNEGGGSFACSAKQVAVSHASANHSSKVVGRERASVLAERALEPGPCNLSYFWKDPRALFDKQRALGLLVEAGFGTLELLKPSLTTFSITLAYKPSLDHSLKRFLSVSLTDFIHRVSYFAPTTSLHTLALFMDHFTHHSQNLDSPTGTEQGSSVRNESSLVGNVPILPEVRSIKIVDSKEKVACIFLPPPVSNDAQDIKKYTEYLSALAFCIPLTFFAPDIPNFKKKYQIPDSVRIRAPVQEERACYYRPGEVCFYEDAFEHGLRFPMDDHVRELLVTMDLAPTQSHEISVEEFITLFQHKDSGGKNKGVFNCPSRLGFSKIIFGLPDSVSNWKKRFFFISGVDWEHNSRYPSVNDLKCWVSKPDSTNKSFFSFLALHISSRANKGGLTSPFIISFAVNEKKSDLVKSGWINDAKDLFLNHYADILVPMMLWRYGLGPRPTNTDTSIFIMEDLPNLDVLLPSERNDPGLKATKVSQKGSSVQGLEWLATTGEVGAGSGLAQDGDQEWARADSPEDRLVFKVNTNKTTKKRSVLAIGLTPSKRSKGAEGGRKVALPPLESSKSAELTLVKTGVGELLTSTSTPGLKDARTWRAEVADNSGQSLVAHSPIAVAVGIEQAVVGDEEDVVITGSRAAPEQNSSQGVKGHAPELGQQDGSAFFVKGFTLPPLSQKVLEQARERGKSLLARSFSLHMSQKELTKTQNELYTIRSDLERAENDKKVMLEQLKNALIETEGLKGKVDNFNTIFAHLERDLQATRSTLKIAKRSAELELKRREDAEGAQRSSQALFFDLEKELREMKESLPAVRCKELAMQQPEELDELEAPSEINVTPELEAKIAEKRSDALAVLHLIRAEEPDVLTKWETSESSPSQAGDGAEE
ncbi:hypothetical protein LguiA_017436 [Lonicera macranthoides]